MLASNVGHTGYASPETRREVRNPWALDPTRKVEVSIATPDGSSGKPIEKASVLDGDNNSTPNVNFDFFYDAVLRTHTEGALRRAVSVVCGGAFVVYVIATTRD